MQPGCDFILKILYFVYLFYICKYKPSTDRPRSLIYNKLLGIQIDQTTNYIEVQRGGGKGETNFKQYMF